MHNFSVGQMEYSPGYIYPVTMELSRKQQTGKKTGMFTNTWKLNSKLVNNQWIMKKSQEKLENILNENTIILWDALKAVLREKCMTINTFKRQKVSKQ
jgi:hypothetical protein